VRQDADGLTSQTNPAIINLAPIFGVGESNSKAARHFKAGRALKAVHYRDAAKSQDSCVRCDAAWEVCEKCGRYRLDRLIRNWHPKSCVNDSLGRDVMALPLTRFGRFSST
jgi:hypothetical protein